MPFLTLDRDSRTPLARQVYGRLREMILAGALAPGARVPSTRELARELGVSRNVTLDAVDQLLAEGFLFSRRGSGTFVAAGAALSPRPAPSPVTIAPVGFVAFRTDIVDFRSGLPDLTRFPIRTWQRLSRQVWSSLAPLDLSYGQPEGRPELRRAIARHITAFRGARCHPDQILVTAGTTQAIGIVSRLLLAARGGECLLEDPITSDIHRIISGFGGRVLPVAVDDQGMRVEAIPQRAHPAFVYVTPSHQFPIGGTMTIQRRIRLLDYARRQNAYIVEDDYDSELRFDSPPLHSIQGLDPQRVVYIGTFSKTLCPALRMAYIVLPPQLVRRGRQLKWLTDLHNSSVDQVILARFMDEGCFARHIHETRKIYSGRRQALEACLAWRFADAAQVLGSPAGIHLCARFAGARFTPELLARIERAGARFSCVEEHAIRKGRWRDTLLIGYGMLDEKRIEKGIEILARCLRGPA